MKTKISLFYKNAIVLPEFARCGVNENLAATLSADMMRLGFIPSKDLYETLMCAPTDVLENVYNELLPALKSLKGADVEYKPMYPNFPTQVMEADYLELFINAIVHYWSFGQLTPEYETLPREFAFEDVKFREIGVIDNDQFDEIFGQLVGSNESLSELDKKVLTWFMDRGNISFNGKIPFKENLCFIAGYLLNKGKDISKFIDTATDVLRVAVALNGGDISLADNTKFKSMPRATRRQLVAALEGVASEEDINRHRGKWVKLFHSLHIGELGSKRLVAIADKIRNNKKITTFNGQVEAAVARKDVTTAVELLVNRPGEFARRIDHLLRIAPRKQSMIVFNFLEVADKVNTRVLLQLLGNLKVRGEARDKTIVFPKGQLGKAQVIRKDVPALGKLALKELKAGLQRVLIGRFGDRDDLGKVWIDPDLKACPLPTAMRSASEGSFQVGRGTRLPFGDDKSTLRFFIYWVGRDIDLSATVHDESFNLIDHIGYTNLRSKGIQSCHSGDITSAPNGASEFIDVTIDAAVKAGARYVVMSVYVYSGPTFAEHKKVYAGWMTRSKPKSNEIYDPKTVEQKIDLTSDSKVSIPVVFDLVERKAIWTDLSKRAQFGYGGNNTHSNRVGTEALLEAIVDKDNKVSLYELFMMHAIARGEPVKNKEDADTVFSTYEGVTPYDTAVINSEYIA
jgi:hypothetical protein